MLERFFKFKEHQTSIATELLAGLSTFLTMSFIIAVNPGILSEAGIDFAAGFIATILATILGTLIMGLYARWPVAVAPGMGLNAYFAFVVVLGYGLSWQQALTAVFISSIAFFLFSILVMRLTIRRHRIHVIVILLLVLLFKSYILTIQACLNFL